MKTFDGYKKRALTDEYALLAGGGHKPLSEFSMSHSHPYLPLAGGTMTGAIGMGSDATKWLITTGTNGANSPLRGIKMPATTSSWLGLFARPSKSSDEGGLLLSEDTCVIYNSFDTGYGLAVYDTDMNQSDWSRNLTFGINTSYQAWAKGGFVKNGSDNTYILLGGGDHKAITDFATSTQGSHADTAYSWGNHANAGYLTAHQSLERYVKHIGNKEADWGSSAPAAKVIEYWESDSLPLNTVQFAYDRAGYERTVLLSKGANSSYGSVLAWGQSSYYLWFLNKEGGNWNVNNWTKIYAGYADLAGAVTITVATNTTNSWINFTDPDKTVKLGIRRPLSSYGPTYYDGTNYYKLYHQGFKPTASDVGAVASRDFYVGTTAVQASSAAQSLNGITSINSGDNKIIIDTSQKFGPNDSYTLADHPGLRICQRNSEGGRTNETSGIMFNGNYIQMWSPADSYCIRYYDDDSGAEIWNISSSAIFSGKANTAGTADIANSVAWSNVSGRPTNVSSFTNDAGYLTSHQSLANCIKNAGTNPTLGNGGAIIQPGGGNPISIRTTTGGSDVGIFYMSEDNCYICNSSDNCYTFGVFDKDLTTAMNDPNAASFCVLSNGAGCRCRGDFTAAGQFYASSDIRLKNNINNISKSIRSFNWNDTGLKSYGLIAQEIEDEYPELVSNNDNGYKSINYTSALCMIIAKLENELDELRERINQLQTPPPSNS